MWVSQKKGVGRTLATAKDRNTIQISLSKKGNVFLTLLRESKSQAAFVPKCIQEFKWGRQDFFSSSRGSACLWVASFSDRPCLHDGKTAVGRCKLKTSQNALAVLEKERGKTFPGSSRLVHQAAAWAGYAVVIVDLNSEAQHPSSCSHYMSDVCHWSSGSQDVGHSPIL